MKPKYAVTIDKIMREFPPAEYGGISIDPRICFGAPRIPHRRITAGCIANRFMAGDSVIEMARSYKVTTRELENCIRFHLMIRRNHKWWKKFGYKRNPYTAGY